MVLDGITDRDTMNRWCVGKAHHVLVYMNVATGYAQLRVKSAVQEREEQERSVRISQEALESELRTRWKRSYETFILPRMEALNKAILDAGYKSVQFDRGDVTATGFTVEIRGVHPLDGKSRVVALIGTNASSFSQHIPWQNLLISLGGQQRAGTFSPDIEQHNFDREVLPHFFP